MANNRMYLVYRPTGDSVYIGKRMSWGWHGTPDGVQQRIEELFSRAENAAGEGGFSQDDFAIALESGENQPHVIDKFNYHETDSCGIRKLEIDPSVPYGKPESV